MDMLIRAPIPLKGPTGLNGRIYQDGPEAGKTTLSIGVGTTSQIVNALKDENRMRCVSEKHCSATPLPTVCFVCDAFILNRMTDQTHEPSLLNDIAGHQNCDVVI